MVLARMTASRILCTGHDADDPPKSNKWCVCAEQLAGSARASAQHTHHLFDFGGSSAWCPVHRAHEHVIRTRTIHALTEWVRGKKSSTFKDSAAISRVLFCHHHTAPITSTHTRPQHTPGHTTRTRHRCQNREQHTRVCSQHTRARHQHTPIIRVKGITRVVSCAPHNNPSCPEYTPRHTRHPYT